MDPCSCQRFWYKGYTDIQKRRKKMTDISHQKSLTNGKGWKFVKDYGKAEMKKITTKAKNIMGGIKATPKFIKKGLKK